MVATASDGAVWIHSDQHSAIPSPLRLRRLDAQGTGWSEVHENATGEVCGFRHDRVACFHVDPAGKVGPVREIP